MKAPGVMRAVGWTLVVPAAVGLLFGSQATAQEPVTVRDSGWFTAMTVDAGTGKVVDPVADSTLAANDLPVGAVESSEHKRSYLLLELPEDTTGATITLPVSDTEGVNYGTPGPVLACLVTGDWVVSRGDSLENAPEVDCENDAVTGEPDADGVETPITAYDFDLAPLVARWAAGEPNNGIALVADTTEPQALYQLTFEVPLAATVGTAEVVAEPDETATEPTGGDATTEPESGGVSTSPDRAAGVGLGPDPTPQEPSVPVVLPPPVLVDPPEVTPDTGSPPTVAAPEVADPEPSPVMTGEADPPPVAAPTLEPVVAQRLAGMPMFLLLLAVGLVTVAGSARGLAAGNEPTSRLDVLLGP